MFKANRLSILVGLALPVIANAKGIEGVITSPTGAPLEGATIEIENKNIRVQSNENGQFSIADLTDGSYEMHIFAPGYAHVHNDVTVERDSSSSLSFQLERSAIEVIDVTATPMHMSVMESAAPVSVLGGESLRRQQKATLGDTLESLPGVQTNFHGNVASTPIIRGLSGPRVLIAQNGLDTSDVSRVGPDHSVAAEASTSEQIEVLRGPATLFYGSGAIGGVVNVVDGRIPTSTETRGEWLVETDSVNDQKLGSFNVTTGHEDLAFYADGYWRESNDYDTPMSADADDPDGPHNVANSDEQSNGFTFGTSYLMDKGYVGISVERFNREYGIPGHSHGGEEEGHEGHNHGDEEHEHGDESEEAVYADLEQTKIQMLGEYSIGKKWLDKVVFRAAHTDYEHAEIEHGAVGTVFKNDTNEARLELLHSPLMGWNGGMSLHYKDSDIAAEGSEAFTPPTESEMVAIALMEEHHFGDFLVQLGGRVERVELSANDVLLPKLAVHSHDNEGGEGHEHGADGLTRVFSVNQKFTPTSVSAGVVWDFTPGYNVAVSLSRSQRAPSPSELLSFGAHIGTRSYEVGALFALDEDSVLGLSQSDIDMETANNIDLTFRKSEGAVGFVFNAFYNQIDNYYYQSATGLFAESGHSHGDEEGHEGHHHGGELPVYLFGSDDATLHGFEAQVAWQVTDEFKATAFSDYVRARRDNGGGDLPRTPPMRFGATLSYQTEVVNASLDITRYSEQDRIAEYETVTGGYTLIDALISYDTRLLQQDITAYLKGTNLTNEEARVHSSFLKDLTPRPGRSVGIGLRGYF